MIKKPKPKIFNKTFKKKMRPQDVSKSSSVPSDPKLNKEITKKLREFYKKQKQKNKQK